MTERRPVVRSAKACDGAVRDVNFAHICAYSHVNFTAHLTERRPLVCSAKACDGDLVRRLEEYACSDMHTVPEEAYDEFTRTVEDAKGLLRHPTTAHTWEIIDGSHRANYLHLFFLNLVPWFVIVDSLPGQEARHFYKEMQTTPHLQPLLKRILAMPIAFIVYAEQLTHKKAVQYTLASMLSTPSTPSDVAYVKRACTAFGCSVANAIDERGLAGIFGSANAAAMVFDKYDMSVMNRGDRYLVVWTMLLMVNMNPRMLRHLALRRKPIPVKGMGNGRECEIFSSAYGSMGFACTLPKQDLMAQDLALYGAPGESVHQMEKRFLEMFVTVSGDASTSCTPAEFIDLAFRRIARAVAIQAMLQPNQTGKKNLVKSIGNGDATWTSPTPRVALSRAITLVALCGETYDEPVAVRDAVAFFALASQTDGLGYFSKSAARLTSVAADQIYALYARWKAWHSAPNRTPAAFPMQTVFDGLRKPNVTRTVRGAKRLRDARDAASSEDDSDSYFLGESDDSEAGSRVRRTVKRSTRGRTSGASAPTSRARSKAASTTTKVLASRATALVPTTPVSSMAGPSTNASGGASSGATAPSTAGPSTNASGGASSGATAPSTAGPRAKTPSATAPGATAPSTNASGEASSGATAPSTAAPSATAPGATAPSTNASGETSSGATAPGTAAPSTAAPSATAPGATAPSTNASGETSSGPTAPGTAALGATAPSTNASGEASPGGATAPSMAAPSTAAPSATAPSTAGPSTTALGGAATLEGGSARSQTPRPNTGGKSARALISPTGGKSTSAGWMASDSNSEGDSSASEDGSAGKSGSEYDDSD